MKRLWLAALTILALVSFGAPYIVRAQSADSTRDFIHVANSYNVVSNITYRTVSNWEAKLDLYQPRGLTAPNPTVCVRSGKTACPSTRGAGSASPSPCCIRI